MTITETDIVEPRWMRSVPLCFAILPEYARVQGDDFLNYFEF